MKAYTEGHGTLSGSAWVWSSRSRILNFEGETMQPLAEMVRGGETRKTEEICSILG